MSKIFLVVLFVLVVHTLLLMEVLFLRKNKIFSKKWQDDLQIQKNDANMQSTKVKKHYLIKQIKGFDYVRN